MSYEQAVEQLRSALAEAREERDDFQAGFNVRWHADMRAIKRWQAESGKELTWPDHADLCVWLMSQVEQLESQVRRLESKLERVRGLPEKWRAGHERILCQRKGHPPVIEVCRSPFIDQCADELRAALTEETHE